MRKKSTITDKSDENKGKKAKRAHSISPEGRENEMIALAMSVAEERMRNGTASSAEIVHFLRLGSSKERLDQEDKRKEIELKSAKTEAIQASQRIEALYSAALGAMRKYSGQVDEEENDDLGSD